MNLTIKYINNLGDINFAQIAVDFKDKTIYILDPIEISEEETNKLHKITSKLSWNIVFTLGNFILEAACSKPPKPLNIVQTLKGIIQALENSLV